VVGGLGLRRREVGTLHKSLITDLGMLPTKWNTFPFALRRVRIEDSKHADFPQRGKLSLQVSLNRGNSNLKIVIARSEATRQSLFTEG